MISPGIFISPEDVLRGIERREIIVIDIRPFSKYARSHIPSALWLYFWDFTEHEKGMPSKPKDPVEIARVLGKNGIAREDHVVIVYDKMSISLASYTYWYLEYMGQEKIYLLKGDMEEWVARELPLEKGVVKPIPKEYRPVIREDIRSTIEEIVRVARGEDRGLILDVRTYEEYVGAMQTTPRPGRIPRSILAHPNIFLQVINGDEKALEKILKLEGVEKGEKIITYCSTGERASLAWLVLTKIAGLTNVKLYPESFYEYSSKKDLEIESGEPRVQVIL